MSPEKTGGKCAFSGIVFSLGELTVLSTLPRADQIAITQQRFNRIDGLVYKAQHPEEKTEKVYVQKVGEPNWQEVKHDAERAFGKKLLNETSSG